MSDSYLSAPHFHDEQAALDFVEKRVWAHGRACPHCGGMDRHGKLNGKSTRIGVWKCYDCRKPFSVKVGTIFEDSHIPLHLWLQAIFLVAASKKGISANQLHRTLGVTLKTAWFLGHRIRLAMAGNNGTLMGRGGGVVEADETYYGRKPGRDMRRGHAHKETVFSLVERGGQVRSTHVTGKDFPGIKRALKKNVSSEAVLMTDSARWYRNIAKRFADHQTVNHHRGEYVRGNAYTNTVEGYFSVFKRGMTGVYQHCDWKHLHRYLAEFDFRYNNRVALKVDDRMRADNLLSNVSGKRLTYETIGA
ncbi:MAG TPA: IS1595 family transposase [Steroidobacteraceae bacterium]|nr:IS1595 family transposase [Steroidobacteraceae bacterium]